MLKDRFGKRFVVNINVNVNPSGHAPNGTVAPAAAAAAAVAPVVINTTNNITYNVQDATAQIITWIACGMLGVFLIGVVVKILDDGKPVESKPVERNPTKKAKRRKSAKRAGKSQKLPRRTERKTLTRWDKPPRERFVNGTKKK